ncbi:hypothetical protein OV079_12930 [Nannocystis pusilla]|uniref:Uncharacterized protein n=1 Tax=Nannocystis pusilla TaxID=889268 RepID=A0A9X3IVM3_9BACT|nr:hypothetical protein [Nannocystis pusilla]MCY1006447.1 hypothetical protein [Nannocystis pusilla]
MPSLEVWPSMAIFLMCGFSLMTEMISAIRPSDSGRIVALSRSNWIFSPIEILLSSTTTRLGGSGSGSGGGGGGGGAGNGGGSPTTASAVASSNTVGAQAASCDANNASSIGRVREVVRDIGI